LSGVAETAAGIVQYFPDEPIVGDSIAWYGEHLQAHLSLLGRLIRPGMTVIEVNAGVGMHALVLGPIVGNAGHLFLYESRPLFQQVLRQNLAANGVTNVTVMKRELAGVGGAVESEVKPNEIANQSDGAHTASMDTIDDLRLEQLQWLKIADATDPIRVLRGAAESLWRLRPNLFVAAPDMRAAREIVACASDFGYRCWKVEHAYFNPQNFNRRETDIFAGRAALAVLAMPEEADAMPPGYTEFT
jgi:hypothetical protein